MAAMPPGEEDAAEWEGLYLLLLVGTLGLTLGGWLLLRRRRPDEELATADEVWLDSEDWLGGKDTDADWEAMLAELARGRLGLRESGVEVRAAVNVWIYNSQATGEQR